MGKESYEKRWKKNDNKKYKKIKKREKKEKKKKRNTVKRANGPNRKEIH